MSLANGVITIRANGRKCVLALVNVPVRAKTYAALSGEESVVTCGSFLAGPSSYGWCKTPHRADYFPSVVVRCTDFDADHKTLTITFAGWLLEEWWDVVLVPGWTNGPLAFGEVRCRVTE